jgi:hypothetical protein
MPEVIEKQFALEQNLSVLTDGRFVEAIQYAEKCVRNYAPNAKLLFTTDRRGDVVSVGVYDVRLFLNERGQFQPIEQPAPQILSERLEYRDGYQERAKLRLQFNVWADAYTKLVALNGIK